MQSSHSRLFPHIVFIQTAMLAVVAHLLTAQVKDDGTPLFNGKDLKGWRTLNGTAPFHADKDEIVGTSASKSPNTFLATANLVEDEVEKGFVALQVEFPEKVVVVAKKFHWFDDGWTMYDTMDATFEFPGNKVIQWDGKSRNGLETYKSSRGTIVYGTEGSVWIDRGGYIQYDRSGKEVRRRQSSGSEGGTQLGGGGDMSTLHVQNFFQAIRGKEKQRAPIDDGATSTLLCHLSNIAYRAGEVLQCDPANGHITNSPAAMKLWNRDYEKGWEPKI